VIRCLAGRWWIAARGTVRRPILRASTIALAPVWPGHATGGIVCWRADGKLDPSDERIAGLGILKSRGDG